MICTRCNGYGKVGVRNYKPGLPAIVEGTCPRCAGHGVEYERLGDGCADVSIGDEQSLTTGEWLILKVAIAAMLAISVASWSWQ